MVSLKVQKRLAASVLNCGKGSIWLDPNESNEISLANSRRAVLKLFQNGLVVKKPIKIQSRYRWRKFQASKRKGHHRGLGSRKGAATTRNDPKKAWIRRIRILRRLLKKLRDQKKIDCHVYHVFYLKAKGGVYKNKRSLLEAIYRDKAETLRVKALEEQAAAFKSKSKIARERRQQKIEERKKQQVQQQQQQVNE